MLGDILIEANKIINGERQNSYGDPEGCFEDIMNLWNAYLYIRFNKDKSILKEDVAIMMVLLKIARELHNHKRDNLVDAVGYLAIANEIIEGDSDEI